MKAKLFRKKSIIIIALIIITSAICLFFLWPRFHEKNFESVVEVPFNSDISYNYGTICYGNIFSCKPLEGQKHGDVNKNELGQYIINYTYTYKDKTIERQQIIKVLDEEAPNLEVTDTNFSYCPNGKIPSYNYKATDNYDGDITSQVKIEAKDENLIFFVSDSSKNETKKIFKAKKIDEEAPKITLKGEETIYLKRNETYIEQGADVTDNCDESLNVNIVGNVDSSKTGEYQLTYQATDSSGLQSSVTRTVYVFENRSYDTPSGKSIYLTFDDGPSANTEKLLNILKKYDVKATFFVTNQRTSYGYDDMIKRAYNEGHTIGLHSYSHVYSQIYSSVDNYFADLYAIQDKVKRITGYTSTIIRFPGGSSNTVSKNYDNGSKIMTKLSKAVESKGFRYFDWNVLSGDAGETTDTSVVTKNVIKALGNNDTYVILQHDTQTFSVNAVESIIQYGLSHGYTFRAITMQTPDVKHHLNN